MAFEGYEWPYVGIEQDRDWLLNKVKELEQRIEGVIEEAVALANAYTDEQLANYQSQFDAFRLEINGIVDRLETDFDAFKDDVNAELVRMEGEIDRLEDQIEADIIAVNELTDRKIAQNNDLIYQRLIEGIDGIKVINFFTGEKVSIQDMFDYLAQLHVENGLTYTELAAKQKTYTELAAYNMTYTQLIENGNIIIN